MNQQQLVDVNFKKMALEVISIMKEHNYSFETAMYEQFKKEGWHLANATSLQRFREACWKEVQQAIADDKEIAAHLLPF
jgi:hypothetical protein